MANAPDFERDKNPMRVHGDTVTGSQQIVLDDNKTTAISKIIWTGFTTAAHIMELTSGDQQHTILKLAADAPGTNGTPTMVVDFDPPFRCRGLRIKDLDSGEVLIYEYKR